MEIGFDVISDLFVSPDDSFFWEGKATSLYCIVAGNVSSDLDTLRRVLETLAVEYQGVFYIPGYLEYENQDEINSRTLEILDTVAAIPNCACLFHHVVIVDGIAILGCNGWEVSEGLDDAKIRSSRIDDVSYVYRSVEKLQKHGDVTKILMISSAVPCKELYYGEHPKFYDAYTPLKYCLKADTEAKISTWIFGSYRKTVDAVIDSTRYINNAQAQKETYWPKRVSLRV